MAEFAYILLDFPLGGIGIPVKVVHLGPKTALVILRRSYRLPGRKQRSRAGRRVRVPAGALQLTTARIAGVYYQPAESGFGKRAMGGGKSDG